MVTVLAFSSVVVLRRAILPERPRADRRSGGSSSSYQPLSSPSRSSRSSRSSSYVCVMAAPCLLKYASAVHHGDAAHGAARSDGKKTGATELRCFLLFGGAMGVAGRDSTTGPEAKSNRLPSEIVS